MSDATTAETEAPEATEETTTTVPAEATEPAAATPPDPDDTRKLAEAVKLNREVVRLEDEWSTKDRSAKAAKKLLENAQQDLSRYIRSLDEEHPLFDRDEQPTADPVVSDPAPSPEAWREWPIVNLHTYGLSMSVVAKLADVGMTTLGALADHTSHGYLLTDLKGIGESKAEAIEQALEKFWADHPGDTPAAEPEPDEIDRRPIRGELNDQIAEAMDAAVSRKVVSGSDPFDAGAGGQVTCSDEDDPPAIETDLERALETESDAPALFTIHPNGSKNPTAVVRAPSKMAAITWAKSRYDRVDVRLDTTDMAGRLGLTVVEVDKAGAEVILKAEPEPAGKPKRKPSPKKAAREAVARGV